MKTVKLFTKVFLVPEDKMDLEAKHGMSPSPDDKCGVWRDMAVPAEEIYRLIKYDDKKTLVEMYDGSNYLVKEMIEDVIVKWETAIPGEIKVERSDEAFEEDEEDEE